MAEAKSELNVTDFFIGYDYTYTFLWRTNIFFVNPSFLLETYCHLIRRYVIKYSYSIRHRFMDVLSTSSKVRLTDFHYYYYYYFNIDTLIHKGHWTLSNFIIMVCHLQMKLGGRRNPLRSRAGIFNSWYPIQALILFIHLAVDLVSSWCLLSFWAGSILFAT